VNVIWDLAPHDLSIMDHLIEQSPGSSGRDGQTHLNGFEDIAFITLYFPEKIIAHINVNWLACESQDDTCRGEKKMLVWNDLEADEKIRFTTKA
jgi:predicted dehydrogenase